MDNIYIYICIYIYIYIYVCVCVFPCLDQHDDCSVADLLIRGSSSASTHGSSAHVLINSMSFVDSVADQNTLFRFVFNIMFVLGTELILVCRSIQ